MLQSIGAALIILGALGRLWNYNANAPVWLLGSGLILLLTGVNLGW